MRDCTGDLSDPDVVAAQDELVALVAQVRAGRRMRSFPERLAGFRYSPSLALQVVDAQRIGVGRVDLAGHIAGDLLLRWPIEELCVKASIDGNLWFGRDFASAGIVQIDGAAIEADLRMSGRARIDGQLIVTGATVIGGDLRLTGESHVVGDVSLTHRSIVNGSVRLTKSASVDGSLRVLPDCEVRGQIRLDTASRVAGDVAIHDGATVRGDLRVRGNATVGGSLRQAGTIGGDLAITGRAGDLALDGRVLGVVRVSPRTGSGLGPMPVRSMRRATFAAQVLLGDGVSIVDCDFRQCGDLDQLDLVGADLFTQTGGSRAKALTKPEGASDGEMGSIYRQLRVNLEGKGNRPASAFFYRGEMDSRRRAARTERRWGEWAWISLYRWVAGYGLRVAPPLLWFAAAWVVATAIFLLRGLVVLHGGEYVSASWWQAASFTLQSMLSVFRPPDAVLGLGTTIVQVVLRILGPILLGLAALAVRDKVAR